MKKVLAALLVIVLVLVAFISSRPAKFHIERSTSIAAAPEAVYGRIVNFHQWAEWSPWEKLDPTMKKSFSGAESGTGAVYDWSGAGKVGQGRMTVTEAQPPSKVIIRLEFIKPFTATCVTTFDVVPEGSGSNVVWTMDGDNDFMSKAMGLFMNMDKSVGGDFERGLGQLKTVAESAPASPITPDSTAAARPS